MSNLHLQDSPGLDHTTTYVNALLGVAVGVQSHRRKRRGEGHRRDLGRLGLRSTLLLRRGEGRGEGKERGKGNCDGVHGQDG